MTEDGSSSAHRSEFSGSNNEAEMRVSATRHRLHIPFPIDTGVSYQESGIGFFLIPDL